jgi:hypothetical protein
MSESVVAPAVAVRFMLDAAAEPGLLPRLMEPFAKRGLVPSRMWSHRGAEAMHVEVALDDAPAEAVPLIEGNLRQVVGVYSVTLLRRSEIRRAA